MTQNIKIAAAQYPIGKPASFSEWQNKIGQWVAAAAGTGAQLLVFPEYAAMELAATDPATSADLHASLRAVVAMGAAIDKHYADLARLHGVTILGGTRPHGLGDGGIVNRANLYLPDGQIGHQDKIMMTRFEREILGHKGRRWYSRVSNAIGHDRDIHLLRHRISDDRAGTGIGGCPDYSMPFMHRQHAGILARADRRAGKGAGKSDFRGTSTNRRHGPLVTCLG